MDSCNKLSRFPLSRTFGALRYLALFVAAALAAGPVVAANLVVDGDCTLADAIVAVNTQQPIGECPAGDGVADTIVLPSTVLTIDEWLPMIDADMIVEGQGRDVTTIDGDGSFRPFFVRSGSVVFLDLTIANGRAQGGTGRDGGGGGAGLGGALLVYDGAVALERVDLVGNTAVGGDAQGASEFGTGGGGGLAGSGGAGGVQGGSGGGGGWYGDGGDGGTQSQAGGDGQGFGAGGGGGELGAGGAGGQGGPGGAGGPSGGGGGSDTAGQDSAEGGGGADGGFGNGGGGSGGGVGHYGGGAGGFGGGGGGISAYGLGGYRGGAGGFGGGGGGGSGPLDGGNGGLGGGGGGATGGSSGEGGFGAGAGRASDGSGGEHTGGGGAGFGGAVFVRSGQLRLNDVRIVDGSAEGGDSDGNGGQGMGGGLFLCDAGSGEGQIDHPSASQCNASVHPDSSRVCFRDNVAQDGEPGVFGPWNPQLEEGCGQIAISAEATAGLPATQVGDEIEFTVTASNVGWFSVGGVIVVDFSLEILRFCGTLAPTETCEMTASYTLTQSDIDAGVVTSTASASSEELDPVTASLTVGVGPDIFRDRFGEEAN